MSPVHPSAVCYHTVCLPYRNARPTKAWRPLGLVAGRSAGGLTTLDATMARAVMSKKCSVPSVSPMTTALPLGLHAAASGRQSVARPRCGR